MWLFHTPLCFTTACISASASPSFSPVLDARMRILDVDDDDDDDGQGRVEDEGGCLDEEEGAPDRGS